MLVPIEITPATILVAVAVIVLVVLAFRRLIVRGMCDCHDHCGDGAGGCEGCKGCSAAADMVRKMEQAAEH